VIYLVLRSSESFRETKIFFFYFAEDCFCRPKLKKIQETVKSVYGDKALKRTHIYNMIKKVKERKPMADHAMEFQQGAASQKPVIIA
jgi:hypothetical protein